MGRRPRDGPDVVPSDASRAACSGASSMAAMSNSSKSGRDSEAAGVIVSNVDDVRRPRPSRGGAARRWSRIVATPALDGFVQGCSDGMVGIQLVEYPLLHIPWDVAMRPQLRKIAPDMGHAWPFSLPHLGRCETLDVSL